MKTKSKNSIVFDVRWGDDKRIDGWYKWAVKRAINRGQPELRKYFDRDFEPVRSDWGFITKIE